MRRNKLSRPRFNLEPCQNEEGKANIYLIYRYNRTDEGFQNRLKYSIRERVKIKDWIGSPTYRANPNYEIYDELNEKLSIIYSAAINTVKERYDIPVKDFKDELDYLLGYKKRPKKKSEMTFLEYFKEFIRNSSDKHQRTIQKYMGVYNHLEKYTNEKQINPGFNEITGDFAKEFRNWIYKKYQSSANTTAKHATVIKQVMKDADLKGYHNNQRYKLIEVKRTKTSKHYLTLSELDQISKHQFSEDEKKLEKVKDIFLIACYTGLRYSDFSVLKKENIIESEGIKMIDIEQYKGRDKRNDSKILVPVLPDLDQILKKYDYDVPKAYTGQEMNRCIKVILKAAKVDRIVKHYSSVAGKQTEENVPIWSKTTNHTARYTFIDMMLNEYNIHPTHLSKITGQTLDVLLGYERGAKDRNAKKVYNQVIEKIQSSKLRAV